MKRPLLLLLCCVLTGTAVSCLSDGSGKYKTPVEMPPKVEPYTVEEGTFDVNAVRSNINLKGMHFDLPQPLSDLDKGWSYELYDRKDYGLEEGSGCARLLYKGDEVATISLENCYTGKEGKSVIYSVSIRNSDCSIYGIIPLETKAEDVERLLGAPDEEQKTDDPFMHVYSYGIINGTDSNGVVRGQSIVVDLNEKGIVDFVKITYSDISGELMK